MERKNRYLYLLDFIIQIYIYIFFFSFKEILASAPKGSKDGIRIRNECWEFKILQVLVLVLKQDFSIVDGDWQTAAALAAILR